MKSYVELVRNRDGVATYLVRTFDAKRRACWFVMKAASLPLLKMKHTASDEMIDLTQYGEVIARGWGHIPDAQAWPGA